jgi:hypothetical protein
MLPYSETPRSHHTFSKVSSPSRKHTEEYPYKIQFSHQKCGAGVELCLGSASTSLVTLGKGEKEYVTVRERNLN